jgi:CDP-glycerol glycerophosphotransferase
MPASIRKVKRGTFKSYFEWATAKIWVDNVRNYKGINKKKKQYYIMTWHGPFRLKKIEAEIAENLSKQYVEDAKYDGKIMNLTTVNNDDMYYSIRNNFWYNGEILKVGVPRNSVLQNTSEDIIKKVHNKFSIPLNKKIVLYCPTFRDNGDLNVYKFDYHRVLLELEKKFKNEYVFLIKLHPNVKIEDVNFINYDGVIINANRYNDTIELLASSDIIVTDYSGLMFDAMAYNKKVFIYASDFEVYGKNRGFIFDLNNIPALISMTQDELIKNIKTFDDSNYLQKCKAFFDKLGLIENDTSVQVITSRIYKEMGV